MRFTPLRRGKAKAPFEYVTRREAWVDLSELTQDGEYNVQIAVVQRDEAGDYRIVTKQISEPVRIVLQENR